jgi:hypothetical protein
LYIRTELDPQVPGGIGYEKWLRRTPDEPLGLRRMIRYAQASPMGIIFPALAVPALAQPAALWLAANRRTVTDYLHWKPGAD